MINENKNRLFTYVVGNRILAVEENYDCVEGYSYNYDLFDTRFRPMAGGCYKLGEDEDITNPNDTVLSLVRWFRSHLKEEIIGSMSESMESGYYYKIADKLIISLPQYYEAVREIAQNVAGEDLKGYDPTTVEVAPVSSHPGDWYLFAAMAKRKSCEEYALWGAFNLITKSFNHGTYGIKTYEEARKLLLSKWAC